MIRIRIVLVGLIAAGCSSSSSNNNQADMSMGGSDLAAAPDLASEPDAAVVMRSLALTVTNVGSAGGTVHSTSTPSQSDVACAGTCTASFPDKANVHLTPSPSPGFYFGGWKGDCNSGAQTEFAPDCALTMIADHAAGAYFTPINTAFVTASPSPLPAIANQGSGASLSEQIVSGADQICGAEAAAAGLSGHYVAWISNTASPFATRYLANNTTQRPPRGWLRPDGKPFLDFIVDGDDTSHSFYPNYLTAARSPLSGNTPIWSGMGSDLSVTRDCTGWTITDNTKQANNGVAAAGDVSWANWTMSNCDASARLFCFQTDYTAVLPSPSPVPAPFKWAFVSQQTVDPSAGLSAFDARCDGDAMAAGLSTTTGKFLALTAPPGASAASRFTTSGVPIVRTDGVVVAAADSDLFQAAPVLLAPIDRNARNTELPVQYAFLGAANPAAAGGGMNCTGWTSKVSTDYGLAIDVTLMTGTATYAPPCSGPPYSGVICLQK
jgi:hypothetical protein